MERVLFNKDDFDNVGYLMFDDNFEIKLNEKSKIIFAPNGSGKTSIYRVIQTKYPSYKYVDYEGIKNDFVKGKKEIIVAANINEINQLKNELEAIENEKLNFVKIVKELCKNKEEVKLVHRNFENEYKNNDILIKLYNNEKFEILRNISDKNDIIFMFKNFSLFDTEIQEENELHNLKQDYLKKAYQFLLEALDDSNICPICDNELKDNVKNIIRIKEENINNYNNKLVQNYLKDNENISLENAIEKIKTLKKNYKR